MNPFLFFCNEKTSMSKIKPELANDAFRATSRITMPEGKVVS